MAAVLQTGPAPKLPPSPPMSTRGRSESCLSVDSGVTESIVRSSRILPLESHQEESEENNEPFILAIRALRVLEDPQGVAAEAIRVFDPHATLPADLVRLLVSSAVRHPDIAQELLQLSHGRKNRFARRPLGSSALQHYNNNSNSNNGAGRQASGALQEISVSSILSSGNETNGRRPGDTTTPSEVPTKPTIKRRLSALSGSKKAAAAIAEQQMPAPPPPRKEKISVDTIKKICKANLKDTQESIEKLEKADGGGGDDESMDADELRGMAEEWLGHETGKFALCLALTLHDEAQRWEATSYLMTAMVDKLRMLLSVKGRLGPEGDIGLPGQDGFGLRDCWLVLSEAERERLATEDDERWTRHLRDAVQRAQHHGTKAWEILHTCVRIQEMFVPTQLSAGETRGGGDGDDETSSEVDYEDAGKYLQGRLVHKPRRHAMSAASPKEITDRWALFFDLLDEDATRRCFRELRLLRQLFNVAQAPAVGGSSKPVNLKSRAKKAFETTPRQDEENPERWLDTKWAMNAMRGFLMSKAGVYDADVGDVNFDTLDRLDNAFCKTFWACLASGDHKRLAKEDGKQWILDILKVFEDRRRYDVMFRLRDIMHFMQANM